MALVTTDDIYYKAIANTIRENMAGAGMNETMRPSEMAGWVNDACSVARSEGFDEGKAEGYEKGHAEGKADGITEGIQTEYDRFWDAYQQNGNRTDYQASFGGKGWNNDNFKPKYDIKPSGACSNAFYASGFIGDLAAHLANIGKILSFAMTNNVNNLFAKAQGITRVGVIDIRNCGTSTTAMFSECSSLVTIDKFVMSASNGVTNIFQVCNSLESLTIEGTIGVTGMNLKWSTKLSKASITSVVNALSTKTSGLTVTFSKTAVNTAFATTTGGTDGSTSAEWTALVNTKKNWTITLA